MADKPFDPTLKVLVETSPEDWPVFVGQHRARTEVIDADIATVSGAADKVLRVHTRPPYLLHLEFQAGHDSARQPVLWQVRNALLHHRHELPVHTAAPGARSQEPGARNQEERPTALLIPGSWLLAPGPCLLG